MFKSVFDIEMTFMCVFSDHLKEESVKDIFVTIFNAPGVIELLDEDIISKNNLVLQIIGLYYKLIKGDFENAKKFFLKAIENGNDHAYINLASVVEMEDKLKYLMIAYDNPETKTLASMNLGIYYMELNNTELMFNYYNEATSTGYGYAFHNLAGYYTRINEIDTAINYYKIAAEKGCRLSYAYLYFHYLKYKQDDLELFNKYKFYAFMYLPLYLLNYFQSIYIDTPQKEQKYLAKMSPEEFKVYKKEFNEYVECHIKCYKEAYNNLYFKNELIADIIGPEKVEELAIKASKCENIHEIVKKDNTNLHIIFHPYTNIQI
jgi:hypothetical protein